MRSGTYCHSGEGSVSLVRALNAAISGLSGSDSSTYVQAFLGELQLLPDILVPLSKPDTCCANETAAIVIIFLLFLFLFTHFTTTKQLGPNRAYFWLLLEFPLAFGLLLFLAAMVVSRAQTLPSVAVIHILASMTGLY